MTRFAWFAFVVCLAAPASAQEVSDPIANRHFHLGLSAFDQANAREVEGDHASSQRLFETAANEFALAYKIQPSTAVLWSWAQSERMGHHCSEALPLYRKFLDTAQSASQIKYTSELIDECERAVPPRWYTNRLGVGLTGGGVLAIGLGITFLVLSGSSHDAAGEAMYLDDFEAKLDEATFRRRIGAVSLGLGVGLLVGGAYCYFDAYKKERQIVAGTDGRSIFVWARF